MPGWDGVRYFGPRDERDVALALTAWAGELRYWTGERAELGQLVIDEHELTCSCGWYVPGRTHQDEVDGWGLVLHEATHAHLDLTSGDPDRDHAEGAGPWTALHDDAIARAVDTMRRCGL